MSTERKFSALIEPGIGLDGLRFGINREEARKKYGDPDKIELETVNNAACEHWMYGNEFIQLTFDEEDDFRMTTITVWSTFFQFKNIVPIGTDIDDFKNLILEWDVFDFVEEDFSSLESPNHILISSDTLEMNFWFDENVLNELQFGPFFIDDDTIRWPK